MPKGRHRVEGVADAAKVAFAREQRKQPIAGEALLWQELRGRRLGVRFRRQHPIGDFVLDFYCAETCLAVEVDGLAHNGAKEHDEWRDEQLAGVGIRVVRIADREVRADLAGVLEGLRESLALPPLPDLVPLSERSEGEGRVVSPSPGRRGGCPKDTG